MKTYKIEVYGIKGWKTLEVWWGMRKSYADGAWRMLKGMYGGIETKFRMVDSEGEILDTFTRTTPRPQ
jgi:hypothetical protein